jgi:hypothetical protein
LRQSSGAWGIGSRRRANARRRGPARTRQDVVRSQTPCQRMIEQTIMGAMGSGRYVRMAAALTLWTTLLLACGQAHLPVRPQPVWLKYCIASSGLAMIVAEQPTEALPPHHVPCLATHCPLLCDQLVVETLMIALRMVVGQVLLDRII